MPEGRTERRISSVPAVILAVAIGVGMAYMGIRLATIGVEAIDKDSALLGILALLAGVLLLGVPLVVLVSQLRSVISRRG